MLRIIVCCALLCCALAVSACGPAAPAISVTEPWVRAAALTGLDTQASAATPMATSTDTMPMGDASADTMPMGGTSAAYMTLVNSGSTADRLISASTDVAQTVELHETTMRDNVMQMAPVTGGIEVPANGQAELKPAGLHVMLIGLTRALQPGETVRLTLNFERTGTIVVDAPVRAP
jgi:copper(I)-binding protein